MSNSVQHYLNLLPSQSRELPKFTAVLSVLLEPLATQQALVEALPFNYDIDTAIGAQLDMIGEWVGITRQLPVPITGVYFEWDNPDPAVGWDSGLWRGPFDPAAGPVTMNDDDYRRILRTKILINQWDGSFEQLQIIWNALLPPGRLGIVIDGQDMTLSFGYEGTEITGIQFAVLMVGLTFLKPGAVRIREIFSSTDGDPIFAWDAPGRGWDEASWSTLINA